MVRESSDRIDWLIDCIFTAMGKAEVDKAINFIFFNQKKLPPKREFRIYILRHIALL